MAPTSAALGRSEQALETSIFESFCLRKIVMYNVRLARKLECFDLERALLGLHRILLYTHNVEEKQTQLWLLADLIARIPKHWHPIRGFSEIDSELFPGLQEFCSCLQHPGNAQLKNMWEQVIVNHSRKCSLSISDQIQGDTPLSRFGAAKENWEWSCFQHYRESFKLWAESGNQDCDDCQYMLSYISQFVEYDDIEQAERYFRDLNLTPNAYGRSHVNCLPLPYTRTNTNIPSLEPFVSILLTKSLQNEGVDRRWLDLWQPLIQMHTGYTPDEVHQGYLLRNGDASALTVLSPIRNPIPGLVFEVGDLEHVVGAVCEEACVIEDKVQGITGQPFDVSKSLKWIEEAEERREMLEFSPDVESEEEEEEEEEEEGEEDEEYELIGSDFVSQSSTLFGESPGLRITGLMS
jgi:hypothetical protein